jgi:tRNA(Leu) C34 or U34 (ribose-2'-O)-methylase TrmL
MAIDLLCHSASLPGQVLNNRTGISYPTERKKIVDFGPIGVVRSRKRKNNIWDRAAEWVPLVRVGNAAEALRRVREAGIFVVGADASAGNEIYEQHFRRDVCVVIGGERKGLRPVLKKNCDALVSIPMIGSIDSLNASVAAGVLFYEVVRQRRKGR